MVRISGLDALRGIAAVSVLLYHYTTRYGATFGHTSEPLFSVSAGFRGVDLFFIISGFVILMTLDRTRVARDFVVSRFSRLFPTYWAAVLATYLVVTLFALPGKQVSMVDLSLNMTMMPELFHAKPVDGAYWTLEVELLFYTVMLALFMTRLLRHMHTVVAVWLALHMLNWLLERLGLHTSYLLTHVTVLPQIPLFGAGMMLYRVHSDPPSQGRSYIVWAMCMLVVAVTGPIDALVAALGGSALVWLAMRGRLPWLSHPALVFLGVISYPLYLLHENIGFTIMRAEYAHGVSTNLGILLATLAMIALAASFSFAIERPAMKWIRGHAGQAKGRRLGPADPQAPEARRFKA